MVELFNDPEFEKYRVKEIEEGVILLKEVYNGKESMDYFRGAMDMLKRVLNVPPRLIPPGSSQKDQADILKAKAFDAFEVKMMRKFTEDVD